MTTSLKRLFGNALEITVVVPWSEIKSTYEKILNSLLSEIELPGFRKGKAPKEIALKNIKKTQVFEEVLKDRIPDIYAEVVRTQELHPIITPKIELIEAEENKDWKLIIRTCENPPITLGEYRNAISGLYNQKTAKIWLPGEKKDEKKDEGPTIAQVLDTLYQVVKVELPEILIEQEVNRMLSNLINETQKLGLTIEQYLQAQGKTSDSIRKEYEDQARRTLTLEFALEQIASVEKVTVEDSEIEEFIKKAKTEAERTELQKQRYYLASILRRQKALSQLLKPSSIEKPIV